MTDAGDVRDSLVSALELELVGPRPNTALDRERLGRPPSRWYLTGFIVPADAPVEQRMDDDDQPADDLDGGVATDPDASEGDEEKHTPARRFFPSSIGLTKTPKTPRSSAWSGCARRAAGDNFGLAVFSALPLEGRTVDLA